jgi:DNA repair photolyase
MTTSYKHAASVTGQVYFCAAPIRLDAYDGCQFGCVYCFSRRRSRIWASKGTHQANALAFSRRLQRVREGTISSALDEFLSVRTPIQLGGLHDPFTPREQTQRTTLSLLRILKDAQYPTLISTKGDLVAEPEYISLLRQMPAAVRFSAAGIAEQFRPNIDRRTSPFEKTLEKIALLSDFGISTGLRIQPVFPGFEEEALQMAERAAAAGVRRISFEYLKLPTETLKSDIQKMKAVLGFDLFAKMQSMGIKSIGWDYSLTPAAKLSFVREARRVCHKNRISFGAGDTEFIPISDGDGCCGSSSDFVQGSLQFRANLSGVVKDGIRSKSTKIKFSQFKRLWSPEMAVSTYLNPLSRRQASNREYSDWMGLIALRWNGSYGPYSPNLFYGVSWKGKVDSQGFHIYDGGQLARLISERD